MYKPSGIARSLFCIEPADSAFGGRDWLLISLVSIAGVAILGKDISRGGLLDPDASAHVMDGVLIHDWILAGPKAWVDPMEFAMTQYGHYPTLGIGAHYPPGFAVVEAGFFLVFGLSATAARMCVVFFGMVAAVGCFVLVRPIAGRTAAVLASTLLIGLPATTQWGRQAMLEIPLMASLIWAAVAFCWYLRNPTHVRFGCACIAAIATLLFKQSGVFLICAMAMTLVVQSLRSQACRAHAAVALSMAIVAIAGVLATLDAASLKTVSGYYTHAPWSLSSILYCPRNLPDQVGGVVLVAAAAGAVVSFRLRSEFWIFLAAWAFVALVMITATSLKTPRFAYVLVLPFAIWASVAAANALSLVPVPRLRTLIAGLLVAYTAWAGFRRPVGNGPDFGALVKTHRANIEGQVVLFSGLRDGDFIFAVREHTPWRASVVIRGSKLFYTCTAGPNLDLVSYVSTPDDLAATMKRFAFTQVFIERENRVGTPQEDWLRRYLQESGDYQAADTVLVEGVEGSCGEKIYVDRYTLAQPWQRQVDHFDIPIPRTKRSIRVDLRDRGPSGKTS